MRRGMRWLATSQVALAIVLAGAGCAGAPAASSTSTATVAPLMAPPSDDALPAETAEALGGLLEQWVANGNGTGVTAAVVSPAGSWSGVAGVDGAGMPLVAESAMSVGSITKTFTAAEVLLLAGEGTVDLDRPISDYVTLPFDAQGATVRQVLGMRSSFPVDPTDEVFASIGSDLGRSWSVQDVYELISPNPGRAGQRGGVAAYNNLNYIALGDMIEQVTGEPFAAAVRGDLLDPAGLTRVWVQDVEAPEPPVAVGESGRQGNVVDPSGPYLPSRALASAAAGAGGIAADAPSIATWGYLLYGGYVIDPELVGQMTTGPDGYGLGTGMGEIDGARVVGHGGDSYSYHGQLLVWPDDQVSVAVLTPNIPHLHLGTGVDAGALAQELQEHVSTLTPEAAN